MSHPDFLYPATPANVPLSVTEPSAAFRKEVSGVMGSILLFLIVYLLLFALSVGLVITCVYAGFAIIINLPRFITILIGAGLIGLGVMVFVFLVKFLFAVARFDRSGSIRVTEEEQPRLFAFIRQLTKDTQTPFPKRIYLSADVNASVFYDSSFWSMFFPVKKNLQIGLGLVNAVNISEFKAVMAHEFGHFSQRSMKLGSFVYHVNRIIYNMLFENNSYNQFLGTWASAGNIFAFFAHLTAKIAQGIQWVLRQMYGVINKSYMRLSREMEFHADAVAASVSGSASMAGALRRIELADTGYSIALQKCEALFRQARVSVNIYQNQRTVLAHLAQEFRLPVEGELPVVSRDFLERNNTARVNFRNQWASHPSTEDRERHVQELAVQAEILTDSPWVLFDNAEQLQAQLTQKIYEPLINGKTVTEISNAEFRDKLYGDASRFSLPEAYNGFFDNRQIALSAMEQPGLPVEEEPDFATLFSRDHAALPKKIGAIANDIEVLKAIAAKNIDTKSFDFDGIKYNREEATVIAEKLEQERQQLQNQLDSLDRQAVQYFLRIARQNDPSLADELAGQYRDYFEKRQWADEFLKQMNEMLQSLSAIYSGQSIPVEQIRSMIGGLKNDHEIRFKGWLKRWLAAGAFDHDPEEKNRTEKFVQSNYEYFSGTSFFENELSELNGLCNESWSCVNVFLFEKFKAILESQLKLPGHQ